MSIPIQWDSALLSHAPSIYPAASFHEDGVDAFFYDALPWHGKPTRVFAWRGFPQKIEPNGCPAMILIHGGGGTAFADWVRRWTQRGYAAIAMDLCGCVPQKDDSGNWKRAPLGGPSGWGDSFQMIREPIADQWPWHAIGSIMLAHALLAADPRVDANRIGATGISWGGYLTCILAGVDSRLQAAIPVYGCGFLGERSVWATEQFPALPREDVARWLELWDPSHYLPHARLPICWVDGTNDFAYPLESVIRSSRLPTGPQTLCLRIEMPHGHGDAGEAPAEIFRFADSLLNNGLPPTRIMETRQEAGTIQVTFEASCPIQRAELCCTRARGHWEDRRFRAYPAELDTAKSVATAKLPMETSIAFLNLYDEQACVVSSAPLFFSAESMADFQDEATFSP